MSQNNYITNSFEGGLNTDVHVDGGNNTTYNYALNLIASDKEQNTFRSNEHSNRLCYDYGQTIVGASYIEDRNSTLVFLSNGELHLLNNDNCTSKFIASDTEFGCDWGFKSCEWVYGEFKTIHPCDDLLVYWSSGCQYYWINIDEMLNPVRKQSLKDTIKQERKQCSDRTCDYFRLFKCVATPKLIPISHQQGGQLSAGAYQFSGRLFDRDMNYTNWFNITDVVYIGSENNTCGERGEGHIEIHVSQLDCRYDGIEIAVIETIAGMTTTKVLTQLHYNAGHTSYNYYGVEGTPIDISEILITKNAYIQGQDLIQKDGRLWLYNTKQLRNLDYQRRANNIGTYWVEYEYTYEQAKRLGLKSHMRDETYAYGIMWNYCSGKKSPVFHIPASGGGTASASSSSSSTSNNDNASPSGAGDVFTRTQTGTHERTRSPIEDTVSNPQADKYDEIAKQIASWEVEMKDVCEALNSCEQCSKGQEACNKERARVEELTGKYQDILSQYGASDGKKDQFIDSLSVSNIKEGAAKLINAVNNRERLKFKEDKYTVKNEVTYEANGKSDAAADALFVYGSQYYDGLGINVTGDIPKIGNSGATEADYEENLVYPDFKNCQGEYIYGGLAGQPVRHHKFPNNKVSKHFESKSTGVPSPVTPDADPLADSYVKILGVAFTSIEFPLDEELSEPLDKNNPYTILYVKRTDANKKVIAKGLATKTFNATNNSKTYSFPRHAVNSKETADRNIDIGGKRILQNGNADSTSFNFHSLDTNVRKMALNFTQVKPELEFYGEGWRYGLQAEGKVPDDTFYGSRIDQVGTREFINLNKSVTTSGNFTPDFKTYARAHSVISPPKGGTVPLMNKYRESSVWIGGTLPALTKGLGSNSDQSFIGDVFDHSVPIEKAAAHYVTLYRDLPNQYGDITGLVYIPLLQGNANTKDAIHGPVGDIFIGPYFFRRTGYISEKVGNLFDIPGGQAAVGYEVTKKEKRSICDPPEDILLAELGTWVHTTLPVERDAADAKNYAGLHSPGEKIQPRTASIAATGPETDYYRPKVLKTLLVYWGEFEVNPHYRKIGNRLLGEVIYPDIRPFELDSYLPHPWEESYLNRFYCKIEQPSKWAIAKKILIRALLTVIFPMIGIDNLFDIASGTDFVGNLVEFPMLYAMWYMLSKQIFTNDYLDKLLGIPECKTDEQGSKCNCTIENFEDNYHGYCWDYSKANDTKAYYGMPEPYNTCVCDNCDDFTNNEVYYSNKQIINSDLDAYKGFNSNQLFSIPADAGKLKKLTIVGGKFIAHTTDNIYNLQYQQPKIGSTAGEILLGQSDLIADPRPSFEGISEGYLGILDSNHAINTQWGYFFIDQDARKIYRYSSSLEEISQPGMYNFFKDTLNFCNPSTCKQEKVPGTNYYSLGIDPRLNRLLVTKSDGCGSYTISYDLITKKWISFHSYIPQFYLWDRDHMYTSNGTSIWKHDEKCNFQTFFGTYAPFIIDFNSIGPGTEIDGFEYKSSILNTEMRYCHEADKLSQYDKSTFNKVWLRTADQTTGYLDLIPRIGEDNENQLEKIKDHYPNIELVYKANQWRFNELYDYTAQCGAPLHTYNCPCLPIPEPTNVDTTEALSKQDYKNRKIFGTYLSQRYILDNIASKKLYLKNIKTYIQKILV